MSNPFIKPIALSFSLLLAGCLGGGQPVGSTAMTNAEPAVAATPAPAESGASAKGKRRWLPNPRAVFGGGKQEAAGAVADETKRSVAMPKVEGRNAAAFEQAVAAMKSGDLNTAERLLRRVTDDQPELAGPWVNLGQVYVQLDAVEEARMAFRQAIAANPENCAAYNQLGVLFRTQGEFQEAENHYLKCLDGEAPQPEVYLNLGILYELYLGRLPEALNAYKQYQQLLPEPDRKVAGWVMDLERRTGG